MIRRLFPRSPKEIEPSMDIPEIDVDELYQRFTAGTPLVDVREPDEFAGTRVPGARSIPLGEVPARVAEIPTEGQVMLICGKGGRSMAAAGFLRSQGFDVVNVLGGTEAWVAGGFPVESGPVT
ncbi:MAG TPA: rhodanese-like domain-containing protein [Acidimicrobiales bacterium]|nr:rhodanese-like domain-containing protein [Acidimicrobiales bacterium]MDP7352987.1 rhodanese-like domain-containing protein [Acidimicrobiales bacterium]MDP7508363.1 rhodanese-like domain-containing protein [Acidimicrobiales bacterium]MEE1566002.1 rhodanese-like domain-containing protein [Acidimicrobiales bacterium]HJL77545.1 rhodanese-like domain-containing protein [Acidimicrobiales bacterium]